MRIQSLGLQNYLPVWDNMKQFTALRSASTEDELWLLEHFPVYTQGQAGKPEHILNQNHIPVIQTDRGGQITYHGPGQLVGYVLMNIQKRNLGIRTLVSSLETILINTLALYDIKGELQCGAPGVFVSGKKIASIGLRVKNGCTYHGIALNINMDLNPFRDINPCGFQALQMTQMKDFLPEITVSDVQQHFVEQFLQHFLQDPSRACIQDGKLSLISSQ